MLLPKSKSKTLLSFLMNWTAQHLGLGFTLFLLFTIFYRRFKAKNRLAASADSKRESTIDTINKHDSPSTAKILQDAVIKSRCAGNKRRYPILRKRRAPTTLTSNTKSIELIRKRSATSKVDHQTSVCALPQEVNNTPADALSINSNMDIVTVAGSDRISNSKLPELSPNNALALNQETQKSKCYNHLNLIQEVRVSGTLKAEKLEQNCKTIILDFQPSLQGNAPAAEREIEKETEGNPRKEIIDIMKLLDFEEDGLNDVTEEEENVVTSLIQPQTENTGDGLDYCKLTILESSIQKIDSKLDVEELAPDLEERVCCGEVKVLEQDLKERVCCGKVIVLEQDIKERVCGEVEVLEQDLEERVSDPVEEIIEFTANLEYQKMNLTEIPLEIINYFTSALKTLNLSSNNLEYLPAALELLTGLEFLYLRSNALKEIPSQFSKLQSLQICDLADNCLITIRNDSFSSDRLQILDLSNNKLESLPTSIGNLRSLRTLILNNNNFKNRILVDMIVPLIGAYASGSNIKGYLFRLQGYLQDISDVQNEVEKMHERHTSSRVPAAGALSFHYFKGRDLVLSATRMNEKRSRIIQELLETEETYVNQLNDIHRLYTIPLSNFLLFSKSHYEVLFSNLDDIRYLHKRIILPAIQAIAQDSITRSIGKLFLSICPILTRYKDFLMNNSNGTMLLNKINGGLLNDGEKRFSFLEWNPLSECALHKFTKTQEAALKDSEHFQLNLAAYLLLPVQRLPRYKLLMDALLLSTDEEHPDYDYICQACDSIAHLLFYLNETKKEYEKTQTDLERTFCRLHILPSTSLNISPLFENTALRTRKFVEEFDGMVILKYVTRYANDDMFAPFSLTSKKSQIRYVEKAEGVFEYKFKVTKESNQTKQIEASGAIAKFDVSLCQGKKCHIVVTTDLLVISNTSGDICGILPLPLSRPLSLIPLANAQQSPQAVVRLCFGERLMFFRGSIQTLSSFGKAIR